MEISGEWEGTLPDAPIFFKPSQPLGDLGVWPSIWSQPQDVWSSNSLDLVAIDAAVVAVN